MHKNMGFTTYTYIIQYAEIPAMLDIFTNDAKNIIKEKYNGEIILYLKSLYKDVYLYYDGVDIFNVIEKEDNDVVMEKGDTKKKSFYVVLAETNNHDYKNRCGKSFNVDIVENINFDYLLIKPNVYILGRQGISW